MAAFIDDDDDDFLEIAAQYMSEHIHTKLVSFIMRL